MSSRGQHVLVTGGAGFIGSHLVEHLVKLDYRVTVIDDLSTGLKDNINAVISNIELVVKDLGQSLQARDLTLEHFSLIFHLAANAYIPPSVEDPLVDHRLNLYNTLMLLESLRSLSNPPRLINVSSAAVYGNPSKLPVQETDPTVPISPYGVSKLAAERYVSVYSQIYQLPATSARLFSVYGPRQQKQVVFDLFKKLSKNPIQIEMLGDGSQSRDFTYVEDVCRALLIIAERAPARGEVFNVGYGKTHTISELIEALFRLLDLYPKVGYTGRIRTGDAENWVVDISRLQELGFSPQITLEAGLQAVKDWYEGTTS